MLAKNIQDAIRDNLPAEVSALLRERLEQADVALETNTTLQVQVKALLEKEKSAVEIDRNLKALAQEQDKIQVARFELDTKERNLVNQKIQHELDTQKALTATLKEVLLGLVRNTTYKEATFSNRQLANRDGYTSGTANDHSGITRTAE